MMKIMNILGQVAGYGFLAFLAFMLWVIIRWSFVSPWLTRGRNQRLRKPNLAEVEAKWNVRLPRALELLYQSDLVQQGEVYLAPPDASATTRWYVETFLPITSRDLSEWTKGSHVPGLPIAIDGDKGTYYLPFSDLREGKPPAVLFRSPERKPVDKVVAPTVDDFMRFQPVKVEED